MKLLNNQNLAQYTSLKAGGAAEKLVITEPGDSLVQIVNEHATVGPVWMLGYGTNCLISDDGLSGTVILNRTGTVEQISNTIFKVSSGYNWDDFVNLTVGQNLYGLEFTSGIPGGTGAAIAGNIAAYGHKVADCFKEASILDVNTGQINIWPNEKLEFDYRSSALQQPKNSHLAVLDAVFELKTEPTGELEYESALKTARDINIAPTSLANRRQIILETRRRAGSLLSGQGDGPYTAGSFFKNPLVNEDQIQTIIAHEESTINRDQLIRQNVIHGQDKARVSAAHVLLAAGFKRGQSWGNVRLHKDHILKIENVGNASAQEIYDVVSHILTTVNEKLGIKLEPEVRFLGQFNS